MTNAGMLWTLLRQCPTMRAMSKNLFFLRSTTQKAGVAHPPLPLSNSETFSRACTVRPDKLRKPVEFTYVLGCNGGNADDVKRVAHEQNVHTEEIPKSHG